MPHADGTSDRFVTSHALGTPDRIIHTTNGDGGGDGGSGDEFSIPQLNADPVAPEPESAWVLRTVGFGGGEVKFLFGGGTAITEPGSGFSYQFSYRTLENTTVRVTLA